MEVRASLEFQNEGEEWVKEAFLAFLAGDSEDAGKRQT
jgi:hypothetical protein